MNEEYKRLVRLLQEEFPVCERPFEQLAARLGTTQEHVMEMTRRLQEEGKLRNVADLNYGVDKNMLATKYLRYAALVVTIMPILTVYPFCQKFFVKGMLIGSVKA